MEHQHHTPADFSNISPSQRVNVTLAMVGAAMHEAQLSLSQITASEEDRAALRASKALTLLATCQSKFADLMEVKS